MSLFSSLLFRALLTLNDTKKKETGSLNYNALQNIIMNNDTFLASLKCILYALYTPPYFLHCLRRTHHSLFSGLCCRRRRLLPQALLSNVYIKVYKFYKHFFMRHCHRWVWFDSLPAYAWQRICIVFFFL